MNLIIHRKNNETIFYFIKNCVQKGNSYIGSNSKLDGMNPNIWKFKWTLDTPTPIYKENTVVGYEESVSDIQEAPKFKDTYVGNKEDVDKVIKKEIHKKYTLEDEIKLLRRRDKEFDEYNSFVETLVSQGKAFKEEHFKESV